MILLFSSFSLLLRDDKNTSSCVGHFCDENVFAFLLCVEHLLQFDHESDRTG